MGMDAGAIAGEGDATGRDEAVPEGRDECSETEELLEPFFIMEREPSMCQGISGQGVCDPGMPVGKFLTLAGFFGRF